MADFHREVLDGRRHERASIEEVRVPVPGNDLRRVWLDVQAQSISDVDLDRRIDIGEGANSAGDRAGRHLVDRLRQPVVTAMDQRVVTGELQAECRRLGVNGVAAPDGRHVLELMRPGLQRGEQALGTGEQQGPGFLELHGEGGVEHVGGGHTLMHEPAVLADEARQPGQERNDVVLHFSFDLIDGGDVDIARLHALAHLPDRFGRALGHRTEVGLCLSRMGLDQVPDAELVCRFPDGNHVGS